VSVRMHPTDAPTRRDLSRARPWVCDIDGSIRTDGWDLMVGTYRGLSEKRRCGLAGEGGGRRTGAILVRGSRARATV
jgi:hypothetical protein